MLELFLVLATIISLTILYKFLPNRKIFIYFCLSLIVVFAIAGFIARNHNLQNNMNEMERYAVGQQQQIFTAWYTNYQKDIDQLDRNWQLYHSIIEGFSADNIDTTQLYERLSNLETEARIEQVQIYTLKAPQGLSEGCSALIDQMLRKTQRYTDAQIQTIAMSKAIIDTEGFIKANHQEQVHLLQDIIIREAPAGLFNAEELSEILRYFVVPED